MSTTKKPNPEKAREVAREAPPDAPVEVREPVPAASPNAVGAESDKTVDPGLVVEDVEGTPETRVIVDAPSGFDPAVPDGLDADAPRIGPYWSQKADNDKRSGAK